MGLIFIENPECNNNSATEVMRTLIIFSFVLVMFYAVAIQMQLPDLTRKEDLEALGFGRIIEKDQSVLKNITLYEVHTYWIVYVKNGSVHDLPMEKIGRIEFSESKWGILKIEFPNNVPKISVSF